LRIGAACAHGGSSIFEYVMRIIKNKIWTRLRPDKPREINEGEWIRSGGKWIVFDRKERILVLADTLQPYIDGGEITSAKYWNGDPSAINVYCLDRDRGKTEQILVRLGARRSRVWEYDYAWDRNIRRPLAFTYSWCSKFRTILRSYGLTGTLMMMREMFRPHEDER
jgi:hypothetical protein